MPALAFAASDPVRLTVHRRHHLPCPHHATLGAIAGSAAFRANLGGTHLRCSRLARSFADMLIAGGGATFDAARPSPTSISLTPSRLATT